VMAGVVMASVAGTGVDGGVGCGARSAVRPRTCRRAAGNGNLRRGNPRRWDLSLGQRRGARRKRSNGQSPGKAQEGEARRP
jgi:hypothetical protein